MPKELRIDTGENLINCSVCGQAFSTKSNRNTHEQKHSGIKRFVCSVDSCTAAFYAKSACEVHEKRRHTTDKEKDKLKQFICDTCQKPFIEKWELRQHENVHIGEKLFECSVCGAAFGIKGNCSRHEETHSGIKRFVCSVDSCTAANYTKGNCEKHEKRRHPTDKDKQFICGTCQKPFIQIYDLRQHENVHIGKKPHSCQFCTKFFSQIGNRDAHERIHTGKKPYSCQFCTKSFTQIGTRNSHERIHTGEKPWSCQFCRKAFSHNGNCKAHERICGRRERTHSSESDSPLTSLGSEDSDFAQEGDSEQEGGSEQECQTIPSHKTLSYNQEDISSDSDSPLTSLGSEDSDFAQEDDSEQECQTIPSHKTLSYNPEDISSDSPLTSLGSEDSNSEQLPGEEHLSPRNLNYDNNKQVFYQETDHINTNKGANLEAPKEKNELGYGLSLLCEAAGLKAPKEKNELGYGLSLLCEAAGLKAPKEKDDSDISSLISLHSHFKETLTPGSNNLQLSELVSGNIKSVRLHMNKAFSTGSCGNDILRQMKVEWSFVTNNLSTAQSLTTICPKPNSIIHPFDLVKIFMFSNEYNKYGTKPREDTLLKWISLYNKKDISQEQVWLDEILFYYNGMLKVWELFRYLDREIPQELYLGPLDIVYDNVSQFYYPISQNIYFGFSPNSFCICKRFCGGICVELQCSCFDNCDLSCLNRSTKLQCNNENCNLFKTYNKCCSNREIFSLISNGPQAGAEFHNTGVTSLGIGLRSTRSYSDGEMIVQYTGVYMKESEYLSLIRKESSTDVS